MLRIQNRHGDWERHQVAIPGRHAKDAENRRIPFNPQERLAPVLSVARLGPTRTCSDRQLASSWRRSARGARVDRAKLRQIDLHWHDLRHEGACRLLAEHVDIRTIH
jgi:integrase